MLLDRRQFGASTVDTVESVKLIQRVGASEVLCFVERLGVLFKFGCESVHKIASGFVGLGVLARLNPFDFLIFKFLDQLVAYLFSLHVVILELVVRHVIHVVRRQILNAISILVDVDCSTYVARKQRVKPVQSLCVNLAWTGLLASF